MTNGSARMVQAAPAAIILAGGEGRRLRELTRRLAGDDRPKQFCRLLGGETLLDQTRRRAARLVSATRMVVSLTRAHERYYAGALADVPSSALVVQPANRGTAPAILYALLRVMQSGPGPVIVLPSDHYVADDDAFMARVEGAVEAAAARPELVVVIGIEPDRPEAGYGWIEPDALLLGRWSWPLYRVRRFWEKPPARVALELERRGGLWNSFVMVAQPSALLGVIGRAAPALLQALGPVRARLGTPWEAAAVDEAYTSLASIDFSKDVLEREPGALAVLPVSGVGWTDLGEPDRVAAARRQLQSLPAPA